LHAPGTDGIAEIEKRQFLSFHSSSNFQSVRSVGPSGSPFSSTAVIPDTSILKAFSFFTPKREQAEAKQENIFHEHEFTGLKYRIDDRQAILCWFELF
jgi:hypothetical protein